MLRVNQGVTAAGLIPKIDRLWDESARTLDSIEKSSSPDQGAPVFTVRGRYVGRGWSEWTQGFQFGSALLQFDGTGDERFLERGRELSLAQMASHVSAIGVHDHGFNSVNTFGALWRLMREGRIRHDQRELELYEFALKVAGGVQAARWQKTFDGTGYVYSFNGPHSLFVDTIRSLRILGLCHLLRHSLIAEPDPRVSPLRRLVEHATNTAMFNVFYGDGRDAYDVWGRTAHESIFNVHDGRYRYPSTQQGYSPFSTWTRGLAWAMLGFAEQLEFIHVLAPEDLDELGGRTAIVDIFRRAAMATCDFYLDNTPTDGIPYWDTGAPGLAELGDYLDCPADPYNEYEPVDSSAAAIAAQGLLRLGHYLGRDEAGADYWQAGLTICETLFDEPYLSTDPAHQGLILHSLYHRPNGLDHIPPERYVPSGESSMWGDYHARELALYVQRTAKDEPYYAFYGPIE